MLAAWTVFTLVNIHALHVGTRNKVERFGEGVGGSIDEVPSWSNNSFAGSSDWFCSYHFSCVLVPQAKGLVQQHNTNNLGWRAHVSNHEKVLGRFNLGGYRDVVSIL